jgi:hypothetical protein
MAAEAFLAFLVGVAALWLVLQPLMRPRSPRLMADEPLDAEETPKGIALAALKEIEFDRETGKLSDEDYELLKAKYTAAAVEALREEQAAVSNDVEALIAARVRSLRSASTATSLDPPPDLSPPPRSSDSAPTCDACGPRPEPDAIFCSSCGRRLASNAPCARCGAALVPGSRFCEGCGRPVAA